MSTRELEVVAVIPARDEQKTVALTVRCLRRLDRVGQVVVVDGSSVDRTAQEADAAGATVLVVGSRRGKGGSLEEAIDRLPSAPAYLLVDADVGKTASGAEALLEPVLDGELDLAIGRLPSLDGGGFGLVKGAARAMIWAACGFDAHEPLSGQRALTRSALHACRPLARGFGLETAMTIDAVRLGLRVGEVPVQMSHRPTGRSLDGFAHRGRQGADILGAALPRLLRIR